MCFQIFPNSRYIICADESHKVFPKWRNIICLENYPKYFLVTEYYLNIFVLFSARIASSITKVTVYYLCMRISYVTLYCFFLSRRITSSLSHVTRNYLNDFPWVFLELQYSISIEEWPKVFPKWPYIIIV